MIVRVWSGFTSRCITLYHAYCLAKEKKDSITVIWPVSNDCYIHFWDVFDKESFSGVQVKVVEELQYNSQSIRKFIKQRKYVSVIRECARRLFFKLKNFWANHYSLLRQNKWCVEFAPPSDIPFTIESDAYLNYRMNIKFLFRWLYERNHNVFANAYCGLVSPDVSALFADKLFNVLKFSRKYFDECKKILDIKENRRLIGIHIRRTDHVLCIKESKTVFFVEKMKELIADDPSVVFFLATDDKNEENDLKKIFGDRLFVNKDKVWGRGTSNGMEAAIVDILCLASCSCIYGSFSSVFSNFAAQYGNAELYVLRTGNDENGVWESVYAPRND